MGNYSGGYYKHYPRNYLCYNMSSGARFLYNASMVNYRIYCENKCSKLMDCVQVYYRFSSKRYDEGQKYITIKHSGESDIYYKTSFKMSMEEYLCLVASVLDLWFGF